jgi:hypothetical protein
LLPDEDELLLLAVLLAIFNLPYLGSGIVSDGYSVFRHPSSVSAATASIIP